VSGDGGWHGIARCLHIAKAAKEAIGSGGEQIDAIDSGDSRYGLAADDQRFANAFATPLWHNGDGTQQCVAIAHIQARDTDDASLAIKGEFKTG
jgi:hypothetical protein